MKIIEITPLENGGHRNQTYDRPITDIPAGWAVIPDDMETPCFPFGDVTAEEVNGVMTVTSWTAGEIPEPEPEPELEEEPTAEEMLDALVGGMSYE